MGMDQTSSNPEIFRKPLSWTQSDRPNAEDLPMRSQNPNFGYIFLGRRIIYFCLGGGFLGDLTSYIMGFIQETFPQGTHLARLKHVQIHRMIYLRRWMSQCMIVLLTWYSPYWIRSSKPYTKIDRFKMIQHTFYRYTHSIHSLYIYIHILIYTV